MSKTATDQEPTGTLSGPRPARPHEREALLAMINFIFRTNLGREPTIAADWPHVYEPENLANVTVVSERSAQGDKLVASTGVWANQVVIGDVQLRVGGINCVGTLPDYRRHGLASQVMQAAHQTMRDLGCHVGLLSTGIPNWYRRLGWEEAGTQRGYRLNRGNIHLLPPLRPQVRFQMVELGPQGHGTGDSGIQESGPQESDTAGVDPETAAALVHLHRAARFGGERSVARFRQLMAARRVAQVVVAQGENGPLAYLLVRENVVQEWAGAAEDVAGLARAYFERMDDPTAGTSTRGSDGAPLVLRTLVLQTPGQVSTPASRWGSHALINLLDARRIPYHNDYLGMLYVVEPQTMLDAYGITSLRLEATGDGPGEPFVLHEGSTTLHLDRRQLTKLFFGPERMGDVGAELFPLPFWQWSLDKV